MNIAIFGGSFDPPHIAHEQIVHKVLDTIKLDKLIVVPTFLNPFKDKFFFTPEQRYDLVETLFFDIKKVEVSHFEVNHKKPVPSIQTVEHLKQKYFPNTIYLIIGADNLSSLHLWQDFTLLNSLVKFIVISRDGYEAKNDIIQFINIKMDIDISSTALRGDFDLQYIPKKIQQKVKEICKKD